MEGDRSIDDRFVENIYTNGNTLYKIILLKKYLGLFSVSVSFFKVAFEYSTL